jgi:class 3 adenylate cyclase
MTKDEQVQLLVSDATRAALQDDTARAGLVEVARREVRGRTEAIGLWTLASEKSA